MNHQPSEDRKMIADSAARLFADCLAMDAIHAFTRNGSVDSARQALGASGLLGACASTGAGGSGLGALDALPIVYEAGRHAAFYPVAESVAAAALLSDRPELARDIIDARIIVAIAPQTNWDVARSGSASAPTNSRGWHVSGHIDALPWGIQARYALIELSLDGKAHHALIDLEADGVELRARKSIDPTTPMCTVTLAEYGLPQADVIGAVDPAWTRLRTILAATELQGAAQRCLDLSVAYMKERKQFGHEIGRFQALKHLAANSALYIENMRLANDYAAWAHDAGGPDADLYAHIAKEYASEQSRLVAEDAVQCHGGTGFTWDYGLHFFMRRILYLGATLGTAAEHREAMMTTLIGNLQATGHVDLVPEPSTMAAAATSATIATSSTSPTSMQHG